MAEVGECSTYKGFKPGQSRCTVGKTITATDVSFFRRMSGWPSRNDDTADELLVTMVSIGLMNRLGFLEGNLVAVMGNEWQYMNKVSVGDTLKVQYEVLDVKVGKKGDKEAISFALKCYKQSDELVADGRWKIMMRKSG